MQEKLAEIDCYLDSADRVLDVGAGNCILCQELGRRGYDVVPVDLKNLSFVDEIVPVAYDGTTLPFGKDSFDVALLITVLHHAADPDAVLREVTRVARRIIVIEEIYEDFFEKYFTLEFFSHPHSNRTDAEWREAFKYLRLDVRSAVYSRSLGCRPRICCRSGGRFSSDVITCRGLKILVFSRTATWLNNCPHTLESASCYWILQGRV